MPVTYIPSKEAYDVKPELIDFVPAHNVYLSHYLSTKGVEEMTAGFYVQESGEKLSVPKVGEVKLVTKVNGTFTITDNATGKAYDAKVGDVFYFEPEAEGVDNTVSYESSDSATVFFYGPKPPST